MSHSSRSRDIYDTKAMHASNGDPANYMQLLMESPYKKHRERAARILRGAKVYADRLKEKETADEEETVQI